ncbi:hypothetical protein NIES4103_44770 [Nostoc sp. NIES-4103]|nr:hypothetical protein NIES4103_44770 [Nostoc sp. NIES-4103]
MENAQYKVQERLSLAKSIFEQGEQLRDRSLVKDTDNNGWTHPYIQYDALVNYLLLTCFDILGQPKDWLSFNAWLEAKRTKSEREEAVSLISESEREEAVSLISESITTIDATKKIHNFYLNKYGVKNSFYRFINEVLDEETRERLLSSVRIEQINKGSPSVTIDEHKEKKSFLYDSRNYFTHQAILTGSPAGGLFPKIIMIKDKKILWGYGEVRNNEKFRYSVRR